MINTNDIKLAANRFYDDLSVFKHWNQKDRTSVKEIIISDLSHLLILLNYKNSLTANSNVLCVNDKFTILLFFWVANYFDEYDFDFITSNVSGDIRLIFSQLNFAGIAAVEQEQANAFMLLKGLKNDKHMDEANNIAKDYFDFSMLLVQSDKLITDEEKENLRKIRTIINNALGFNEASNILSDPPSSHESKKQDIDNADPLSELSDLIGLSNIKEEVTSLFNFLNIQKIRQERGMATGSTSLHSVFMGSPGTGKTTVARIVGKIYKQLGFLKKGHLVEVSRADLVGGYMGQTAIKTDEVFTSAIDGILFIDEAYTLASGVSQDNYGQEAIDTILKKMEDHRHEIAVIVAGYTDEMKHFIGSNPGIKSRFNRYFSFQDYNPGELLKIFLKQCNKGHYDLEEEAIRKIHSALEKLYSERDKNFGNGRLVRNIYEKTIERQANRIVNIDNISDKIITTLLAEDIEII